MSVKDNPFAASQGDYATEISFGAPNAGAGPAGDLIRDTTTAEFTKDVIQESRNQPVLVDFWAPWCGPCKQLTPVLEKAVRAAGGTVKLVKMNIDDHPAIAGQLGVQSIPAVIAFRDGQPVDGFMGAVPESQVQDFIQRLGGDPKQSGLEAALEQAAAAIQAGDDELAAQIYSAVLAEEAGHPAAIAGLARLSLDRGDLDGARALLEQVAPDSDTAEIAGVRARLSLAEETSALGDPQELLRRLEKDADDHDARFDLALIQNASGAREEAADSLLHIVRRNREWRDDGARAQLLTFFEAWGPTDEATLSARRKLSALLFS
ncbi:MAG: thioredoxin [Nitratireductor sp.]|uniref:thioredoxin n=1 Tax=Parasphingorhabdus sp. TaxID=2709688 RepID=UPI003274333A